MSRDYKARRESRPRRRNGRGICVFWFATGALVGALGMAVAWMLDGFNQPLPAASDAPQQAQSVPKPRFDYHSILPEMEVVVPDDELADRPPALPQPPPPPPAPAPVTVETPKPPEPPRQRAATPPPKPAADGASYLLQVASLKSPADAERLKAKLALLGVQAQIQRVTINGKDTYHRVRAGPYRGKSAANQARTLLARNGLESITIKLK